MNTRILRFVSFEYLISYGGGAWLAGAIADEYARSLQEPWESRVIILSAVAGAFTCAFTAGKGSRKLRLALAANEKKILWASYIAAFLISFIMVPVLFFYTSSSAAGMLVVFGPGSLLVILAMVRFRHALFFPLSYLRILGLAAITGGTYLLGLICAFIFYVMTGIIVLD